MYDQSGRLGWVYTPVSVVAPRRFESYYMHSTDHNYQGETMGISINGVKYNLKDLAGYVSLNHKDKVDKTVQAGGLNPKQLLDLAASEFGLVENGNLYTVWNEYYEGYGPASELLVLIGRYYDIDGFYTWGTNFAYGTNADEVAEELGLELHDED